MITKHKDLKMNVILNTPLTKKVLLDLPQKRVLRTKTIVRKDTSLSIDDKLLMCISGLVSIYTDELKGFRVDKKDYRTIKELDKIIKKKTKHFTPFQTQQATTEMQSYTTLFTDNLLVDNLCLAVSIWKKLVVKKSNETNPTLPQKDRYLYSTLEVVLDLFESGTEEDDKKREMVANTYCASQNIFDMFHGKNYLSYSSWSSKEVVSYMELKKKYGVKKKVFSVKL
jgi:hypothetical protein